MDELEQFAVQEAKKGDPYWIEFCKSLAVSICGEFKNYTPLPAKNEILPDIPVLSGRLE